MELTFDLTQDVRCPKCEREVVVSVNRQRLQVRSQCQDTACPVAADNRPGPSDPWGIDIDFAQE